MLSSLRQSDATELVDAYLSAGLLQQDEVNLHRPTVRLSTDVQNGKVSRMTVLGRLRLSPALIKRLSEVSRCTQPAPQAASPVTPVTARDNVDTKPPTSASVAASAGSGTRDKPPASGLAAGAERSRTSDPSSGTSSGRVPTVQATIVDPSRPLLVDETATSPVSASTDDWYWTWQLLVDGYAWSEVMSIRRKSDLEVATDLQQALRQNKTVQRAWLSASVATAGASGNDLDTHPTVGQQRLLRELQRRSAAGV
jgi:hypothetical protein